MADLELRCLLRRGLSCYIRLYGDDVTAKDIQRLIQFIELSRRNMQEDELEAAREAE
jgi:hypothetical protein